MSPIYTKPASDTDYNSALPIPILSTNLKDGYPTVLFLVQVELFFGTHRSLPSVDSKRPASAAHTCTLPPTDEYTNKCDISLYHVLILR